MEHEERFMGAALCCSLRCDVSDRLRIWGDTSVFLRLLSDNRRIACNWSSSESI
jgi:hypothetical protein